MTEPEKHAVEVFRGLHPALTEHWSDRMVLNYMRAKHSTRFITVTEEEE